MWNSTKILATIGPASASQAKMQELIRAGVDVFRVNFSHGSEEQHEQFLQRIRAAEAAEGRPIAICGDLCGPKIRVGLVQNGEIQLTTGQELVVQRKPLEGNETRISTTLPELVDVVRPGESILLADGRLRLEVLETRPPDEFTCQVVVGGPLKSGKGVNLPQTQMSTAALTEKDLHDAAWIAERDFDYVALSFVQQAEDVEQLRRLLAEKKKDLQIIAKIEKPQAIGQIDSIIDAADAIMVARGDLGVEMDYPSVPITQKMIAQKCELAAKPCIIATEMLESMVSSPRPTRAEVSDVANAVFDRVDAVMLSAESAIGSYPVAAVTAMQRTLLAADTFQDECELNVKLVLHESSTAAALSSAVRTIMKMQPIAAVAVFTVSGTTARLLAKYQPPCPIVALSSNLHTLRRCCLYRGVMPQQTETPTDTIGAVQLAARVCAQMGVAKPGERLLVLAGHPFDIPGNTNGLVVMTLK